MIPEHLVFIDLESTGTNTLHDRVTEVGFCEVHNGEVVEEWSSLVNPGKTISPFIEQITGITTAMVADAPRFSEIAAELQEKLAGKVLVAHNASFDYGFLKSEFRRLDIVFQEKIVKAGSKPQVVLLKDLGGDELEGLYGMFRTRRQAKTALREILDSPDLLPFDLDGYKILTCFLGKKWQLADFIELSLPVRAALRNTDQIPIRRTFETLTVKALQR